MHAKRSRLLARLSAVVALALVPAATVAIATAAAVPARAPRPGGLRHHGHDRAPRPGGIRHHGRDRAPRPGGLRHHGRDRAPRPGGLRHHGYARAPEPGGGRLRARARLVHGRRDPAGNRTLSGATMMMCSSSPQGQGCTSAVLAAIDAARAGEGVRPMHVPAGWSTLSSTRQLFLVADLERVDRGLVPASGLAPSLNRRAWAGARGNTDPSLEPMHGNWAGSNWAGGFGSVLEADFEWMYDDGPGSPNIDCASAGQSGCWGHRDNILAAYQAPLAMGAAVDGVSMAELFVGHDVATGPNQPDALAAPRWPAVAGRS